MAEAAAIWARATARRDGEPEPTDVTSSLAGIQRRLALEGATLTTARRDGRTVGFSLVAPRSQTLEVFYLAVDPDAWGLGVAAMLLQDVEAQAHAVGRRTLELWVIDDNARAKAVYERAGWNSTDRTQHDRASGRTERRYVRDVGAAAQSRS